MPDTKPDPIDHMLYLDGSKQSYRCTCGCNVFREVEPGVFTCNACQARYRVETDP